MKRLGIALVALAAVAPASAAVAQPGVPDFLAELNRAALGAYHEGRQALLEGTSPIIVVTPDELVLRRGGVETRERFTPPRYHQLKSIAHLALGIHGALRPSVGGPVDRTLRARVAVLRDAAGLAAGRLEELGLTADSLERQRRFLGASLALLDRLAAAAVVDGADVEEYGRTVAPWLLASAAEAARLQLDGLHSVVQQWRAAMTPEEWLRLYVVVLGPKTPRPGNLQFEYFAYALGREAVDRRLIYAEGVFDVAGGLQLLATLLADRAAGRDLFAEERRLERDMMADGAQAHLLRLFGKTGGE
jgi:hypothetical protein